MMLEPTDTICCRPSCAPVHTALARMPPPLPKIIMAEEADGFFSTMFPSTAAWTCCLKCCNLASDSTALMIDCLIVMLGLEARPSCAQNHAVAPGHDSQMDATNCTTTRTYGIRYVEEYLGGGGCLGFWRPSTCWLRWWTNFSLILSCFLYAPADLEGLVTVHGPRWHTCW